MRCTGVLFLVCVMPFGLAHTSHPGSVPQDGANTLLPFLSVNCYTCHNSRTEAAGMDLEAYAGGASILEDRATAESVLRMLQSGQMPPAGLPRPEEKQLKAV